MRERERRVSEGGGGACVFVSERERVYKSERERGEVGRRSKCFKGRVKSSSCCDTSSSMGSTREHQSSLPFEN